MEAQEFQVNVACRQASVYRVHASDADSARRIALERWRRSDPSDVPGIDGCELDAVTVRPVVDRSREVEDEEVLMRFVRERERLLGRLGTREVPQNDAISAFQAASDLGWLRRDGAVPSGPDVVRAALALERLCQKKRLVCFERNRVREGERGPVRLYCTPDYLDALSETLEGSTPPLLS